MENTRCAKEKIPLTLAGNRARRLVNNKMAENSIAKELLDEIDVFEHTRVARHIPRSSEISLRYFEASGLASEYFLDLDDVFLKNKRKLLKSRTPNANHVFEIFGKFSHENADVVRASIVDYITCDPVSFKERMVVVLTMLHLNLDEWLLRIKDQKSPADEGVVYGLCQLYSRHALAYTTGSVWSTLEIHGKCLLQDVKRHCDIHLVFLEGGVLGQLHKKPSVPKLMSVPCLTNMDASGPSQSELVVNVDHTYSSPTPRTMPCVTPSNMHNDHTYAEDSDFATEPYGSDSDGKTNCATAAEGRLVIASTDKLEISIQCSQSAALIEETGTRQNASEMLLDASNAGLMQPTHETTETRSTSPDETPDHKALLEVSSTPMLPNAQSSCPDETIVNEAAPDVTSVPNTEQMLSDATVSSLPAELDATKNDQTKLPEVTNSPFVLPEASLDTVVNVSNQKPTMVETESLNEALVNSTMQVTDLQQTLREKSGETQRTRIPVDQNLETLSSENVSLIPDKSTREQIIGEISYSDKSDADHRDISSEHLVTNFKLLETSSVVSELTEFSQTPETNDCLSSTADSPSHQSSSPANVDNVLMDSSTTDSSVSSTIKRARLKSCIIQLTELSNQERNKWLSGTSRSTSRTTDTDDSSTTSGISRYNMRTRPVIAENQNRKTSRHRPVVNYSESGVQDSGRDSDYEVKMRPPQPLDNKSYPSASRIATQRVIESNHANKHSNQPALPDETIPDGTHDPPENQTKDTLPDETPNPVSLTVTYETDLPLKKDDAMLPDETGGLSPDKTAAGTVTPGEVKPESRRKGVFKTKTITIWRVTDPRTFKCSVCGERFPSVRELNAHYIQSHRNVNCDICGKSFATPSSLRKHRYSHIEESEQFKCRTCDKRFPFESQLKSHRHTHQQIRYYRCASANCDRSFRHPGDLAAHVRSHGKSYDCAHCNYSNTDIRNLRSHMRVHSREAPFTCKECDQKFVHSNQLVRHRPKCPKKSKTE